MSTLKVVNTRNRKLEEEAFKIKEEENFHKILDDLDGNFEYAINFFLVSTGRRSGVLIEATTLGKKFLDFVEVGKKLENTKSMYERQGNQPRFLIVNDGYANVSTILKKGNFNGLKGDILLGKILDFTCPGDLYEDGEKISVTYYAEYDEGKSSHPFTTEVCVNGSNVEKSVEYKIRSFQKGIDKDFLHFKYKIEFMVPNGEAFDFMNSASYNTILETKDNLVNNFSQAFEYGKENESLLIIKFLENIQSETWWNKNKKIYLSFAAMLDDNQISFFYPLSDKENSGTTAIMFNLDEKLASLLE
jgi:hypothetical protein